MPRPPDVDLQFLSSVPGRIRTRDPLLRRQICWSPDGAEHGPVGFQLRRSSLTVARRRRVAVAAWLPLGSPGISLPGVIIR